MAGFFHDVFEERGLRMWVNNPTPEEAQRSIEEGAVACTTNPTYPAKTLEREPDYARQVIDSTITAGGDERMWPTQIMSTMVKRIADQFLPLYKEDPGSRGFVSIQPNPFTDGDPEAIIRDALGFCDIAENIIPKIPATKAGLTATEFLLEKRIPVLVTEVMSISQAVYSWNLYDRVTRKTGHRPAFFVTHITGILDEYLKEYASSVHALVENEKLEHAGTIVALKQYDISRQHNYTGRMLGGGARSKRHFLNMVGMNMDVTINWEMGVAVRDEFSGSDLHPSPDFTETTVRHLCEALPDFRRAYDQHGLSLDEFESYGGVQRFRNAFLRGWLKLEKAVAERKAALGR